MKNLEFKLIKPQKNRYRVVELLSQLNPAKNTQEILNRLELMTQEPNYQCFGLFDNNCLIGISSGWTTVRIYCGKQLELDNVIIDSKIQSKGFGKYFLNQIKQWSICNNYESISLNTYIENSRSHKFYFNQGFKVLGFHFEQNIQYI